MGATPILGEIAMFAGNFAPNGWAFCEGQTLSISQNTALFSLIGTFYGGNGTTTFALPDLRGRVPVGQGEGPGLGNYFVGEQGGAEQITLAATQMPSHSHAVEASSAEEGTNRPAGAVPAEGGVYAAAPDGTTTMDPAMIAASGGGQAHENRPPYLGISYIIALVGIFPSRN